MTPGRRSAEMNDESVGGEAEAGDEADAEEIGR